MGDPFQELSDEHRVIEKVLGALEAAVGRDVGLEFYARAIDFIATFADGTHHAKEEERLFTYLEERGMPRDYGPISVMLLEHDSGRRHVQAMREQFAEGDLAALGREGAAFAALMRDHIEKEENALFPMGRAMLTPEEVAEISAGFREIPLPEPSYEHWLGVAERLASEAGVPA